MALETAGVRLKHLLEGELYYAALKEIVGRNWLAHKPSEGNFAVGAAHQMCVMRACEVIGISRSLYRYETKRPETQGTAVEIGGAMDTAGYMSSRLPSLGASCSYF